MNVWTIALIAQVMIDLGTNNEELLNDPLYVGLRRRRVPDSEGEEFVTEFLDALNARWPHAIAQFEVCLRPQETR